MNVSDVSRVMGLRAEILARSEALQPDPPSSPSPFMQTLNRISALQDQAGAASEAFERGDLTDIATVMIARQKAAVAFEATIQVRNKVLAAYRDIMNMGI